MFKLHSTFQPTGDQPQAINSLVEGIKNLRSSQVLLGVTGSGKTFTMANVIERVQKPILVISHNKTLAAQLYQEFRDFFPKNAVSYFVSYYDFYQPEAYIPQTDTYIEKETEINEEIDKLRLAATTNLLTRKDTIIVASVSCIYNLGSPREYGKFVLELKKGVKISQEQVVKRLVELQYSKSNFDFKRGTFRTRGEILDVYPAYEDLGIRLIFCTNKLLSLLKINPLTGEKSEELDGYVVYPAKHYMTDPTDQESVFSQIRKDLERQVKKFKDAGKIVEAERLKRRVNYDLEMIAEIGYVNGIENYSRYFDSRKPGDPPYTLLDYFKEPYGNDWLLFIDESHMTVPQLRGMYNGDIARKKILVDFGFRLPAAFDNRPLNFDEFLRRIPQTIFVSATPDEWEINRAETSPLKSPLIVGEGKGKVMSTGVVEQLIRPTGIVDPDIIIRPTTNQISDLTNEIIQRKKRGERVLVTTLTKRMAEDLSEFLKEKKDFKVHYLHSDIKTLDRSDILDDLRLGKYDVLIGINLLREGLDLPEVSLVAILDADKEGFLRSTTSLIQTMGRAARHISSTVIMYADVSTNSMKRAIAEIDRRRRIQIEYNKKHKLTPQKIVKPVRSKLIEREDQDKLGIPQLLDSRKRMEYKRLLEVDLDELTPSDKIKLIRKMTFEMKQAAKDLNFELAAEIRDMVKKLDLH